MPSVFGFGSDNHATVHPEILKSIFDCNTGHAHSYGLDYWTNELQTVIENLFSKNTKMFLVYNGTAANILALKSMTHSFNSVICSDIAHINVDECGGPEIYGQLKLIPLPSNNGKITLDQIKSTYIRRGDQHFSQVKVISLTQPTEVGTCYSREELFSISNWAKQNKILLHIDGARFSNACHYLNHTFKELTQDIGVDVISFGGTKNGLMMGEMLLFLNPSLAENFKYLRKQFGQLPSKSRFLSAQFLRYFQNDLWKEIAKHTHNLAKYFSDELKNKTHIDPLYPVESNAVFISLPKNWIKELKNECFFYVWDENTFACRIMFSWDNQKSDIDKFIKKIQSLSTEKIEVTK